MKPHGLLHAAALTVTLALPLRADSTISPTHKHAYSANAGWINFRHDQPSAPNGLVFGEYFLSGHAYGANIGWIHFGWAAAGDANRPRVDLLTGAFGGYVYSANLGWIHLGSGSLVTTVMAVTDTDGDRIADAWEQTSFGTLSSATASSDADGDGVSDQDEYVAGTDPGNAAEYLRVLSHTYNGAHTQATVVFTTDPSRLYRLETSDVLAPHPARGQTPNTAPLRRMRAQAPPGSSPGPAPPANSSASWR